jgi:acetylornithine deacetylase
MTHPLDTLLEWIDIDSTTGSEAAYGDALARRLEAEGFDVERQEVAEGRFNVLGRLGEPEVVFCTHQDTVPPWIAPRREGNLIFGRGACDAKGQAVAMLEAARILRDEGQRNLGFLFTVGEEVDSIGAQLANERLADPWRPRYIIIGEPTNNEFIRGGKGVFRGTLHAHGVAGHSSQPVGPSAIHELVGAIGRMLADEWGCHDLFGEGTINFGEIDGGLAANVVAPTARATVMVRAVEDPSSIEARIRGHLRGDLGEHVDFDACKGYGPIEFHVPAGGEGSVVAFGTDAPFLPAWGTPLLYGPGDIEDAHTADEKLEVKSFERAVVDHVRTVRELFAKIGR